MRTITQDELHAEMTARFGADPRKWKFKCPACGTAQSAEDFFAVGFKPGTGEVNKYLGFSCIGRFTNAGDKGIAAKNAGKPWDKGCNWTLGGLLHIHELEVILPDGSKQPAFEIADAPKEVKVAA